MGVRIISPEFSFVIFSTSNLIEDCQNGPLYEVLPVIEDNDVWFQFILETDTKAEADAFCADTGNLVRIALGQPYGCNIDDPDLIKITFDDKPERSRIDETHVLYNWVHGFPAFSSVIDLEECFSILVLVLLEPDDTNFIFCSSTVFKRQDDSCFSTVVEYGNNDNFADFLYCPGSPIDAGDCTPTEISFEEQTELSIPYTASLQAKYGDIPTVQIWTYDGLGHLTDSGVIPLLDTFPPTLISADLGGTKSGIIKIS